MDSAINVENMEGVEDDRLLEANVRGPDRAAGTRLILQGLH